MIRTLLLIFLASLLGGCTTITPPITGYTLTHTAPNPSSDAAKTTLTLKISGTKAPASLSSSQLFYLSNHQEMRSYLYSRWNDTPGVMIDRLVGESIYESRLFFAVLPKTSSVNSDLLLESTLSSFHHRIHDDNRSEGYLDITYILINPKTKQTVASKRFRITAPAPSIDARGGVSALNRAANELAVECTAWLHTTMKENGWIK